MEKLIQLIQELHNEMGADAWVALGVLLVFSMMLGMVALFWIRNGGLAAGNSRRFFAAQRDIAHYLDSEAKPQRREDVPHSHI